jgi:transposase-like protein
MRWPDGIRCPKCGSENEPYTINRKSKSKNRVNTLYRCRDCRKQFSATVGTIFEDSKIPLNKWLAALFLMCSSKKGISAHQLYRMLDLGSYRSAWFMAHRIREAMREKGLLPLLSGDVEADETYLHPRRRRGGPRYHEQVQDEIELGLRPKPPRKGPYEGQAVVFGIQERGGEARTVHVPDARARTLHPIIRKWVDALHARIITDQHPSYRSLHRFVRQHDTINHELDFVVGDVHTQNIDNYWSIFKRGVYGVFHHIGDDYLPCYLSEFDFRRNRREVSDAERFVALMGQLQGRLTWFCQTPQPENPYA